MKFHVHVYKMPEKAEFDLEAINEFEARVKALAMAIKGELKFKPNNEGEFQSIAF